MQTYQSPHVAASSAIRNELKNAFPKIKFYVKSKVYSGGDSVSIMWTDGPTVKQVRAIVDKYEYGHFDGMTDTYVMSNNRKDIPQVKYVLEQRTISDELLEDVKKEISNFITNPDDDARKLINVTEIPHKYSKLKVIINDDKNEYDSFYKIIFETDEDIKEETISNESEEIIIGNIKVVSYSEKAIAVLGETKPVKDKLKELGGRFNAYLSCGAGWIFPKTKFDLVVSTLKTLNK